MRISNIKSLYYLLIFVLIFGCEKPEQQISPPKSELVSEKEIKPIINDTIKLLAIGNSFSEDAIETHLYDIAKADGKNIIIGNLYIGGASLEQHVNNVKNNTDAYSFRVIDINGKKTTVSNTSIPTVLKNEKWTHISFQQASPLSGIYSSWEVSLPELYNYVLSNVDSKKTKFIVHQTWAYAQNSTHDGFKNYNKDQTQMYKSIIDAVTKSKNLIKADYVIPVGTAIQNGRTSSIGDNFTRDGYHLSIPLGRYLAACTWYDALFDVNIVNNSYKPKNLSDFEISLSQNAAHLAILKPNEVTKMVGF